jgi:hypothetical protein
MGWLSGLSNWRIVSIKASRNNLTVFVFYR